MPERESKVPSRVSVGDLLRLKRCERPAPEFWAEFERTLRQKQLAALVEKRSWWHDLVTAYGRLGRFGVPLGAAAILAVTFLSARNLFWMQNGVNSSATESSSHEKARSVPTPVANAHPREDRPAALAVSRPQPAEETASTTVEKGPTMVATAVMGAARPAVTPVSWLEDVLDDHANRTDVAPVVRPVAVNFAAFSPIEPDLVDSVARPLGF